MMKNKNKLLNEIEIIKDNFKVLAKKSGMTDEQLRDAFAGPSDYAIQLCTAVVKEIPEFTKYKDFFLDEENGRPVPYSLFGIFGRFLTDSSEKLPETSSITEHAFQFVNNAYNDVKDEYVRTMFATEIFENLTISHKTQSIAKKYLKGEALSQFEKENDEMGTRPHRIKNFTNILIKYPVISYGILILIANELFNLLHIDYDTGGIVTIIFFLLPLLGLPYLLAQEFLFTLNGGTSFVGLKFYTIVLGLAIFIIFECVYQIVRRKYTARNGAIGTRPNG